MKFEPQMSGVNEQSRVDEIRRQRLLDATNIIPWEADAQTWLFTYIGHQVETLLGYPAEQWYEKDFWVSHLHPADRDFAIKFCETSSKTLTDFEFEYRMIAADGRTVWLNDVVNVATENGTPQVLRGFLKDITELKQAEVALQESRALLDSYIATAPVGMAIFDLEFRYINVNETLADINGISIENHIHKRPRDILPGPLGLAVEKRFRGILRTGQSIIHEEISGETLSRPGVTRHWLHSFFPILGAKKKPKGIGITVIETTKIKEAEEQLRQSQKMEALGTLSGGIAHDFNNILYPIFIYADLLLEKFDADSQEYTDLKEITSAAQRAKDLVSQVLMFSRRSQGVKHVCDLVPVIKEAMKLMRAALPANITIEEKIPDGIVPVFCDSTQMYQVVVNICTNAGQAILDIGKITITLDSSEVAGIVCFNGTKIHGDYCRLTVTNSGVGMDAETQAKIFEPFFTTREVGQGTGLGLSTVFGIVQVHEGGIKVSSEADKGTTFEVFLPLAEGPVETLPESRANLEDYAGAENILFVDDEKSIRNLGHDCLERFGYIVTAVSDGQQALEIFAKNPDHFNLIVTDQTMPNMTGEKLANALLKLRPDIPIIICTGHSPTITPESSKALGISAFLQKPLAPTQLMRVVREVLDQAKNGKI